MKRPRPLARVRAWWAGLAPLDRLILAGYLAGAAGAALFVSPLLGLAAGLGAALLFVAALSLALAYVHDRRTPPAKPEVQP